MQLRLAHRLGESAAQEHRDPLIGRVAATLRPDHTHVLRLRLSRTGRALLARRHHLLVRVEFARDRTDLFTEFLIRITMR